MENSQEGRWVSSPTPYGYLFNLAAPMTSCLGGDSLGSEQNMTMNQPPRSPQSASPTPTPAWRSAETKIVLEGLSSSLRQALADHQMMLDVLLQRRAEIPLELGELFEDASNAYMEMSESVSRKFLIARGRSQRPD